MFMVASRTRGSHLRRADCMPKRVIKGLSGIYNAPRNRLFQMRACAGPTGTETLKNLVLGGIAAFTVVDGSTVAPADLGNNFMAEASALGQARAPAVTSLLKACCMQCLGGPTVVCHAWHPAEDRDLPVSREHSKYCKWAMRCRS
jgi:hypothetical protein